MHILVKLLFKKGLSANCPYLSSVSNRQLCSVILFSFDYLRIEKLLTNVKYWKCSFVSALWQYYIGGTCLFITGIWEAVTKHIFLRYTHIILNFPAGWLSSKANWPVHLFLSEAWSDIGTDLWWTRCRAFTFCIAVFEWWRRLQK